MNLWQNLKYLAVGDMKASPDVIMGYGGYGAERPKDYLAFEQTYGSEVWVYRCASARAKAVSSVPLLFSRNGKPIDTPPILKNPNEEMSLTDLIESWELFMALTGNAYWELALVGSRIGRIYPMRTDRMTVKPGLRVPIGYTHTVNGKAQDFPREQVVHSKYEHPYNDWYGMSPIESMALAIDTGEYIRKYGKNFFLNSARPDYVLESDGSPNKDVIKRLKAALRKKHGGYQNAHNPMILTGGLKLNPVALSPKDAEFLAQAKLSREEIIAGMECYPAMVGLFEYANYANSEAQLKMFYGGIIKSDCNKLAAILNREVLPRTVAGVTCQFDFSQVEALAEDKNKRSEREVKEIEVGLATINEVRESRGQEPVAWGDEPPVRNNNAFIDVPPAKSEKSCGCGGSHGKEAKRDTLAKIRVKKSFAARDRLLTPIADEMTAAMKGLFDDQMKRALKRLAELVGKSLQNKLTASELLNEMDEQGLTHTAIYDQLKAAIVAGAMNGEQLVGGTIAWDIENTYVIEAAGKIGQKLAEQVTSTTLTKLQDQITAGISGGEGYQEMKKRVQGVFTDASSYRAEMIARTESANAWGNGQLESYRSNDVTQVEWIFGSGPCSSGICEEADGQTVNIGDDFPGVDVSSEPAHPNCYIPGAQVIAPGLLEAQRTSYSGPVIEIRTSSGVRTTVTPNHPILTDKGFVAAQHLGKGDYLINCSDPERVAATIDPYLDHTVTAIENVFESAAVALGVFSVSMPPSAEDFHGDGRFMYGNIDIVNINSLLLRDAETPSSQHGGELVLSGTGMQATSLASGGTPSFGGNAITSASPRLMSSGNASLAKLSGSAGKEYPAGFLRASDLDAGSKEFANDSRATDAPFFGKLSRAFPGLVTADKIVKVRQVDFCGHVYNLSTKLNWYMADNIITHNCTCTVLPVID